MKHPVITDDPVSDRLDELRAIRLREEFGQRRWLVSWQGPRPGEAPWLARLSGPELPLTVERRGRSRMEAIRRATEVLMHLSSEDECE